MEYNSKQDRHSLKTTTNLNYQKKMKSLSYRVSLKIKQDNT